MSNRKNTKVQIDIVGELPNPERRTTPPADHWLKVAANAVANEGDWLRIRIPHLTRDRHKQAVTSIRRGTIVAFREGGFDARYIDGDLYVRWVNQENAASTTTGLKVIA